MRREGCRIAVSSDDLLLKTRKLGQFGSGGPWLRKNRFSESLKEGEAGGRVVRVLDRIAGQGELPEVIIIDNGQSSPAKRSIGRPTSTASKSTSSAVIL